MDPAEVERRLDSDAKQSLVAALEPDEEAQAVVEGAYGNAVIATNHRLLVFKKSVLGGSASGPQLAGWRHPDVRSVDLKKGRLGNAAIVIDAPPLPDESWKPRDVMLRGGKTKQAEEQLGMLHSVRDAALAAGVPPAPTAEVIASHQDALARRHAEAFQRENLAIHPAAQAAVDENLMPGEAVQAVVRGELDTSMIATDRRVFVFKKGFLTGAGMGKKLSSYDYRNLTGIQLETGVVSGVLSLQGPGIVSGDLSTWSGDARKAPHALWLNRSNFDQARRSVVVIRKLMAESQQPTSFPSVVAQSDVLDQLRKLGDLRDAGILTEEEFNAKKAELLARM